MIEVLQMNAKPSVSWLMGWIQNVKQREIKGVDPPPFVRGWRIVYKDCYIFIILSRTMLGGS